MKPLYQIDLNSKLESRKTLSEKPLRIIWTKKTKKEPPKSQKKHHSKWKPISLSLFFCLSVHKNTDILVFCQHRIFYPFLLAIHSSNFCVINLQKYFAFHFLLKKNIWEFPQCPDQLTSPGKLYAYTKYISVLNFHLPKFERNK